MENKLGWASPGVRIKPPGCQLCPFAVKGSGFCGDYVPADPKVALLLDYPSTEDIVEQVPFESKASGVWLSKLIRPLGRRREDLLVAHTIRCHPPDSEYPSGWLRTQAEKNCRTYDTVHSDAGALSPSGIESWGPDLFLVTYHPREFFQVGAYYRQILRDLEKAFRFADRGYKPCVLMGREAVELVAPWTLAQGGGIKTWRSHWWEGSWPYHGGVDTTKLKGFIEAKSYKEQYGQRRKKRNVPSGKTPRGQGVLPAVLHANVQSSEDVRN